MHYDLPPYPCPYTEPKCPTCGFILVDPDYCDICDILLDEEEE